ncbi:carboxylating nicotinate-nucleotide diphosphorylase [Candidatus Methanoliparum sp. LAM-1]|uniref:carboxylating nicotinate-nucleotide diphosphorylase n=1 Tax=Candidatus Methanoliparum sp. LAM-1 TaxID=2874846 RepID=UPI001E59D19E|nr:carboxylating nicotinate-nucleotide diphosphorylase [Candidatus Methanoliparum sp. LAM-1]BDC35707.1 nicotinate-nucleotide pyrophosphorylase [Candidatus Methanoliparum sp. LAM-1]
MEKFIIQKLLKFIEEDAPYGDITSTLISPDVSITADISSKEACILAGMEELIILSNYFGIDIDPIHHDSEKIYKDERICHMKGNARDILLIERSALNLLSRMSGIATLTRMLQDKIDKTGFNIKISSTRKTAPGLRYFDKKAVMIGGGYIHRMGLSDSILIKDNHIAILGLDNAIKSGKEKYFTKKIEVEVETPADAIKAAQSGAEVIMLDNFASNDIKKVIDILERENLRNNLILEVSGGITPENILDYAIKGIDLISVGFLTHSVKGIDFSLSISSII